ncbi:MAG: Spy/CpxP family protein refolding chaperone [Nannocystaceae bacterium]
MKYPMLFLSTLLGAVVLSSPVTAATPMQSKPNPADRICARLDCSDAQREEIGSAMKRLRQQQRTAKTRMRALVEKISAEFKRARPDESVIYDTYAEMDRLRLAMRDAVHESVMSIHQTLNARQRETAAPMLTRMLLGPSERNRRAGQRRMRGPGHHGDNPGDQRRQPRRR